MPFPQWKALNGLTPQYGMSALDDHLPNFASAFSSDMTVISALAAAPDGRDHTAVAGELLCTRESFNR
jgi:hypothetical protein